MDKPLSFWMKRAAEAKELAQLLNDPETKCEMEWIARAYERLANYAAAHLNSIALVQPAARSKRDAPVVGETVALDALDVEA